MYVEVFFLFFSRISFAAHQPMFQSKTADFLSVVKSDPDLSIQQIPTLADHLSRPTTTLKIMLAPVTVLTHVKKWSQRAHQPKWRNQTFISSTARSILSQAWGAVQRTTSVKKKVRELSSSTTPVMFHLPFLRQDAQLTERLGPAMLDIA